jgi:CheY-like chemotaxis protein
MPKVALVVDDSMLIRYSICRFLEARGFKVESATNGCEALETLGRLRPDLVITDLQMPKMSGSELITALKSRAETASVPIIVVAAKATAASQSEKRADFTICKDIEIDAQLAEALEILFRESSHGHSAGN